MVRVVLPLQLKEWKHFQEEAAKRDHRKIGRVSCLQSRVIASLMPRCLGEGKEMGMRLSYCMHVGYLCPSDLTEQFMR